MISKIEWLMKHLNYSYSLLMSEDQNPHETNVYSLRIKWSVNLQNFKFPLICHIWFGDFNKSPILICKANQQLNLISVLKMKKKMYTIWFPKFPLVRFHLLLKVDNDDSFKQIWVFRDNYEVFAAKVVLFVPCRLGLLLTFL